MKQAGLARAVTRRGEQRLVRYAPVGRHRRPVPPSAFPSPFSGVIIRTKDLAALACAALVLVSGAACGKTEQATTAPAGGVIAESKSGGKAESPTTGGPTTDESTGTGGSNESPPTTGKNPATTSDLGTRGLSEDCNTSSAAVREIGNLSSALMNPSVTKADLEKLDGRIEEVRKTVPDAMTADFDKWTNGLRAYARISGDMMDNGGMSNPDNLEKFEEMNKVFSDPEWLKALDNVNAYMGKACSGG